MDYSVSLAVYGCCFFFLIHFAFRLLLQFIFQRNETESYVIACRAVSAIQAIIASVVGATIASSCNDIMRDVHWLTNSYVSFGTSYFLYDTWAMYAYNIRLHSKSYTHLGMMRRIRHFLLTNKVMMVHHIILPFIIFPCVVMYRDNRGDFFFGVFYMIEVVVPLISAREILMTIGMKYTRLYTLTSIAMIVAYFVSRILVFPYLYYAYAVHTKISIWHVPSNIPIKCNVSCLLILIPQLYWFLLMLRGLKRALSRNGNSQSVQHKGENGNHNIVSQASLKVN